MAAPNARSKLACAFCQSEAEVLLRDIEGIEFCRFTEVDVVRHPLVQQIIKAYDAAGGGGSAPATRREPPAG